MYSLMHFVFIFFFLKSSKNIFAFFFLYLDDSLHIFTESSACGSDCAERTWRALRVCFAKVGMLEGAAEIKY